MCRSIKTLFNFQPPVTEEEIRAASLQFVRKVSGFNKPSKANQAAFLAAVDEIAGSAANLLSSLETNAPPRSRAEETAKASTRSPRFPKQLAATSYARRGAEKPNHKGTSMTFMAKHISVSINRSAAQVS